MSCCTALLALGLLVIGVDSLAGDRNTALPSPPPGSSEILPLGISRDGKTALPSPPRESSQALPRLGTARALEEQRRAVEAQQLTQRNEAWRRLENAQYDAARYHNERGVRSPALELQVQKAREALRQLEAARQRP